MLGNIKTGQGDYAAAVQDLELSLASPLALDDQWGVGTVLLSIARTAAAQGNHQLVVRISGSIHGLHENMGARVKVPFRERFTQNLSEAEHHLGRERFLELLAEGARLTPPEAVSAAFAPVRAETIARLPP